MPASYLTAVQKEDQEVNPLFRFFGARLAQAKNGQATLVLPVSLSLCQGGGLLAGGIMATIADEAMAHALMSVLEPHQNCVTVEMNIRYLRAAHPENVSVLTATARVVKKGAHMAAMSADILDDQNHLLAVAGATFSVLIPPR
ncbi:MAG: PaaI family thioesterase [Desulfovibrio sp.]|jgi:uncharacterized protein (TIGR00369 family)|nr:PaaI family thioesterase [Desulfovibrio sp.]